jgi:hypothetical protein
MLGSVAADVVVALIVCAAIFALIAWFSRDYDPEAIDEEEGEIVKRETPEERAEAMRREQERLERSQDITSG